MNQNNLREVVKESGAMTREANQMIDEVEKSTLPTNEKLAKLLEINKLMNANPIWKLL